MKVQLTSVSKSSRRSTGKWMLAATAVAPAILAASAAQATYIYQDNFTHASGSIAGDMPSPVDTGSATWSVLSANTMGTGGAINITENGSAAVMTSQLNNYTQEAYLPITLSASTTYVLTATVTPTLADANWLALGIGAGSTTPYVNDPNGVGVLYSGLGGADNFVKGSSIPGSSFPVSGGANIPDTFTITLTTPSVLNSGTWNAAFSDSNGYLQGTETENFTVSNSSVWNRVYIVDNGGTNGTTSGQTGDISGFSFATTPAAASLGLLALSAGGVLIKRRKRNA